MDMDACADYMTSEVGIVAEREIEFQNDSDAFAGMCSCVCISDEGCCACFLQ